MSHPLTGGSAADVWAAWLTVQARRPGWCSWSCRACGATGTHRDPVAAVRAHLAEAHGDGSVTYTRLSLMGTGR